MGCWTGRRIARDVPALRADRSVKSDREGTMCPKARARHSERADRAQSARSTRPGRIDSTIAAAINATTDAASKRVDAPITDTMRGSESLYFKVAIEMNVAASPASTYASASKKRWGSSAVAARSANTA